MKKSLLFIFAVISINIFSQDCDHPLQACNWANYSQPLSINSTAPTGPQYGCLTTQPNPTFFYIQVKDTGSFVFNFKGSAGGNVDVVCWGPFGSLTNNCIQISGGGSGNIVDCSYSTANSDTITIPHVSYTPPYYYVFCVTNVDTVVQTLDFSQIGGTGSTSCDSSVCYMLPASICYINTNDSLKNEIYFNHNSLGLQGTIIYRKNALSTWDSIGYVTSGQPDVFVDPVANPNQQAYTYCIAQLDSCDSLHAKSSPHTTIFLQSSLGTGTQVNLSWNAYGGAAVASYYIYRGTTPFNMTLINQVSSTTYAYTDLTPPAGFNYYKVLFNAPTCTSNSPHDTLAGSNYRDNSGATVLNYSNNSDLIKIYPNPAQKNINVYNNEIPQSIEITDLMGNSILIVKSKSNLETINIENLARGVYFVKVVDSKGIFCRKFLVE